MSSEIQLAIVTTVLVLICIHIVISIISSINMDSDNKHSDYDGDNYIWTKESK